MTPLFMFLLYSLRDSDSFLITPLTVIIVWNLFEK